MKKKRVCLALVYAALLTIFLLTGLLLLRSRVQAGQASAFYDGLAREEWKAGRLTAEPSRQKPAPEAPPPLPELSLRVAQLTEQYPDIVAWLRVDGTPIDYPVVQGEDNQAYLSILPDGSANAAGSIFLDCRCGLDGRHLILYGHNMRSGSMFGSLRRYLEAEYLEEHPEFSLFTGDGELRCRVLSARKVDAYDDAPYAPDPMEGESADDFIRRVTGDAFPVASVGGYERIVTLSTCTGAAPTQRLVVQAGILP